MWLPNDLVRHVLSFCASRNELVALACTHRAMRTLLLHPGCADMMRCWPSHLQTICPLSELHARRMLASPTGRCVRHLDLSKLVNDAPLSCHADDLLESLKYPLASLILSYTKQDMMDLNDRLQFILPVILWSAFVPSNKPATRSQFDALETFCGTHLGWDRIDIPCSSSSSSQFVRHFKRHSPIHSYNTAEILRQITRKEIGWKPTMQLIDSLPVVKMMLDWVASPVCRQLKQLTIKDQDSFLSACLLHHGQGNHVDLLQSNGSKHARM
jgi:hypothetical protein